MTADEAGATGRVGGAVGKQPSQPLRELSPSDLDTLVRSLRSRRRGGRSAIPRQSRAAEGSPLSFAQQRLWLIDQLAPGSPAYNIAAAIQIAGELDEERLERSLQAVVRRQEALRTTFEAREPGPVQIVHDELVLALPVVDLLALPELRRHAERERLALEQARRGFDLACGPLLRALLFRLAAGGHTLLMTLHHIVADGWSAGLLIRDLGVFYEAAGAPGLPSSLPELPIGYADFAAWQRRTAEAEPLAASLAYWRAQLAGARALLLPSDRPRRAADTAGEPSARGGRHRLPPLRLAGPGLSPSHQGRGATTPFMILLAALAVVLHRWTGDGDITIGSPIANRSRPEVRDLVGFFANTVVLRLRLAPEMSFAEVQGEASRTALEAYSHQDLPYEWVVEALGASRTPLFEVMLVTEPKPPPLTLSSVVLSAEEVPNGTAKFDLLAAFEESAGLLSGELHYRAELFDRTTVARLASHLSRIVAAGLAEPERTLAELPLLTAPERQQVLREWNDTAVDHGEAAGLHSMFEAQARRTPADVAVVFNDQRLTFGELNGRANRLARHLRALGVAAETRVGVLMERSLEVVVALLAVLKAGGAYVPLDPEHPRARLDHMRQNAELRVLLTQSHLAARAGGADAAVVCLDTEGETVARQPSDDLGLSVDPRQAAYAIYTSGSTGTPKGVVNCHGAVVNRLAWMQDAYRLTAEDRVLQKTPFSFDVSVWELFWPLAAGARLVVARPGGHRDPAYLVDLIAAQGVTTVHFVPSLLQVFLEHPGVERCASLRRVVVSGEALPFELEQRFFERLGAALYNLYGPTEAAIDVTHYTASRRQGPPVVPIGRPIANLEIRIVDRTGQPVPAGVAGELRISGAGLARGYLGRPDLTAESFVPDPFSPRPGARAYRTGDVARLLPTGEVHYLGRADHQVKLRGFRVELGGIEAALASHPAVRECVVVAAGEAAERRLVAYFVAAAGAPHAGELQAFLRQRLPDHEVPAVYVCLDAMPLSPNGKVDRRALPMPEMHRKGGAGAVPLSAAEELVATAWEEVLGVAGVGRNDDFFELGGHSLAATRVLLRLREAFGVTMPLRLLFEASTVADLAAAAERTRDARAFSSPLPPLLRVARDGRLPPLSFGQRRLWFLDQLEPGSTAYNLPAALSFTGPLDAAGFARAWGEVVRRHEALRTVFLAPSEHGASDLSDLAEAVEEPCQTVSAVTDPASGLALPQLDLSGLPPVAREREAAALEKAEAGRGFDLARGPLVRPRLLRLSREQHRLLVCQHHIVTDGWSLGILLRELAAAYDAHRRGRLPELPELPVQYADFAVWQRAWLQGEALSDTLAYWRRQLADAPPRLELPADRPRAPGWRAEHLEVELPRAAGEGLRRQARQAAGTLYMALLAGFAVQLCGHAGTRDLTVGTPVAGRGRREVENLIGFFVNMLPIRLDLAGDPSWRELLKHVRETVLSAHAHQDLPFEKLIEELDPRRSRDSTPLFQVVFDLAHAEPLPAWPEGLRVAPRPLAVPHAKFDLNLTFEERPDRLVGTFEYRADRFDRATVARFAARLTALLVALGEDGEAANRRVSELPVLPECERAQLLWEWNDTAVVLPERRLHDLVAAQAALTPDAVAVSSAAGQLTYGGLEEAARRMAGALSRLGAGPEVLVALCLPRGLPLLTALLAVLKAGGAYLPLDPSWPPALLRQVLADSGASLVLTEERHLPGHASVAARMVGLEELRAIELEARGRGPDGEPSPAGLACVLYTSGSTGRPKGVLITHGAAAWYVRTAAAGYGLAGSDRVLQFAATGVDVCLEEIFICWSSGATLVVADEEMRLSARRFLERCRERRVSVILPPTAFWHELAHEVAADPRAMPESLRVVGVGGERVAPERVEDWQRQAPAGQALINCYGPTEAMVVATTQRLSNLRPESVAGSCGAPGALPGPELSQWPIGRPIAGTEARVLDPGLDLAPIGVAGELWIGGAGVARGYLGRPDLTAERFLPDPFSAVRGARIYRTGDIARTLPDGRLDFLGRRDHQVKVRGFRVELGEIEAVLGEHPEVRDAVVVAHPDAAGGMRLSAFVAPRMVLDRPRGEADEPGATETERELRSFLRERLPDHMVPAAIVVLAALPVTATGKIDRRNLAAQARTRCEVGRQRGEEVAELAAPRLRVRLTAVQEIVAACFRELLEVDRVAPADSFFELGGHSLLATRLISRLRRAFAVDLPLASLFEVPTLAGIAAAVERARADRGEGDTASLATAAIAPVPRDGRPYPMSFAQQRLWLLERIEPGSMAHNVPGALELTGPLAPSLLAHAVGEMVRRHETLRTVFAVRAEEPVQIVQPMPDRADLADSALPLIDLSRLAPRAREQEVEVLGAAFAARPFDLGSGPLFRMVLLRLAAERHVLLVCQHHIVTDGWSMGILVREVTTLYGALQQGRSSPLPELPLQYLDYACWQRSWLSGERLTAALAYWRRQLAGAPALLDLPTDRPRGTRPGLRGARVGLSLAPERVQSLARLGAAEGATLSMSLLAAWLTLLGRRSGQEDLVVGLPVAGRDLAELEGIIGYFVNAVPLRVGLAGDPTFRELLRRVRDAALGAFAHQEVPFDKLVEELRPPRHSGRSPIFQAVFNSYSEPLPAIAVGPLTGSTWDLPGEISKYDLTLYVSYDRERLVAALAYSAELFDEATATGMVRELEALLAGALRGPDLPLSRLHAFGDDERQERAMGKQRREEMNLSKLLTIERKRSGVPLAELVKTRLLDGVGELPLVVEPAVADVDLVSWAEANRTFLDQRLLQHGALLFRGFALSLGAFERFARVAAPELVNYVEGSSPRILLGEKVYTSTEYPAELEVSMHNELSYAHRWPAKILFYCVTAPQVGGETPIADSRKVFALLDPSLRQGFIERGVKYVRNLRAGSGAGLSWQTVFETEDREAVERYCREGGIEFRWQDGGGLWTSQIRPAAIRHPRTGDEMWFNQVHQFHPSNLGPDGEQALRALAREEDLPINAYYGDGSPLEPEALAQVRAAYQAAAVTFPWQENDLLLADNMLVAHGRKPFSGPRRIVVAMGETVALESVQGSQQSR